MTRSTRRRMRMPFPHPAESIPSTHRPLLQWLRLSSTRNPRSRLHGSFPPSRGRRKPTKRMALARLRLFQPERWRMTLLLPTTSRKSLLTLLVPKRKRPLLMTSRRKNPLPHGPRPLLYRCHARRRRTSAAPLRVPASSTSTSECRSPPSLTGVSTVFRTCS